MNIVSVIPIARGIGIEELTYFTSEAVSLGQLVSVPLRKKNVPALVVTVRDASKEKTILKKAAFSLKKVSEVHGVSPLTSQFLKVAQNVSEYYATSIGAVLDVCTPKDVLANPSFTAGEQVPVVEKGIFHEKIFQDTPEERMQYYKGLVREAFAKNKSVLLIVPTVYQVATYAELLGKGVTTYVLPLHSTLSKKKVQEMWARALSESHPLLIVATPGFVSVPRNDIGIIVCEDEASRHYFGSTRPYLDMRIVLREMARVYGALFVRAGTVLQVESWYTHAEGEIDEVLRPKNRIDGAVVNIVDMQYDEDVKKPAVISNELEALLKNLKNGERAFIFVARRGLSPLLRCRDCGLVKVCTVCDSPLTLHNERDRELHCHRCGKVYPVTDTCSGCGGWRIDQLGITTGSLEELLLKLHLSVPLLRIDSDTTKTPAQVKRAAERWYTEGGVLVGTEMALPFVRAGVLWSAIASMDALLGLPHFRIQERLFEMLVTLRLHSKEELLVQTRIPEHDLFSFVQKGTMQDLYTHELHMRAMLGYPPYKTLIQITLRAHQEKTLDAMEKLKEIFSDYTPLVYTGMHPKTRGGHTMHLLMKIEPALWPLEDITQKLRSLGPAYEIRINPESIF